MATKAKGKAKITEPTWRAIHAAFVVQREFGDVDEPPTLRDLARTFGVPFAEAEERAQAERWELERAANGSRSWLAVVGEGAATEAEFVERFGTKMYGHLMNGSPEANRWVKAFARERWIGAQANIARWDAFVEERNARDAYDAYKDRTNRCEHCRTHAA